MSRLSIDMTEQQHQSLKAMAALKGQTIKEYALERLFPGGAADAGAALQELRELLQRRLAESVGDEVVSQSISEIAEGEIRAGRTA
ncbi:MAG: antitoxin [Burkholderiaceae bacterium]